MAFNKLMRALGFRNDDDYDDTVDYPSALPLQQVAAQTSEPVHHEEDAPDRLTASSEQAESTESAQQIGELDFPLTIFDSLLQVFNDAQPDFIRKCLDVDAQRRYLYDSIDSSFKEYIARYQASAREMAKAEAENSLLKLRQEVEQLHESAKDAGKLEEDLKHLKISSDRQKRTFNERIRDLEAKLGSADAEKEQLQLEIKSLLNKVKVAAVHEKDAKAYKEDLDNLRKQLKDGVKEETAQLRESLENANQRVTAMNAQNMAREAEAERLRKETESLKKQIDSLNKVIEDQKKAIADTEATIESLKAERVAPESMDAPTTPEPGIQSAELPTADGADVAEQQSVSDVPAEPKPKRRKRKPRKPSTAKISAIDETLDETEWLIATPPEGVVSKAVSMVSDSDFGYQEPPRKQPPVNDAQMSLF
ncbi:MAG: hypothetical protein NC127_07390 [Muribaculum sp.]|nr:hypothetical protein [Muribaculum sp.]